MQFKVKEKKIEDKKYAYIIAQESRPSKAFSLFDFFSKNVPNIDKNEIKCETFDAFFLYVKRYKQVIEYLINVVPIDSNASLRDPFDLDSLKNNCINELSKLSDSDNSVGFVVPSYFVGTLCSLFGIHTEDLDVGSVNILLYGDPKIWIIVPPAFYEQVIELMIGIFPSFFSIIFINKNDRNKFINLNLSRIVHINQNPQKLFESKPA